MSIDWTLAGGATPYTCRVKARLTTGTNARLRIAPDRPLAPTTYTGSATIDAASRIASFEATGLRPHTRYAAQVEVDGVMDASNTQYFKTVPVTGEPTSYSFAFGGCAGEDVDDPTSYCSGPPYKVSNHPVFDDIADAMFERNLDFFAHLGDANYSNSSAIVEADRRRIWDETLGGGTGFSSRGRRLYQAGNFELVWDDHDFGPNNSDATDPGRDTSCIVFRKVFPTHDLPAGTGANGIYRAWTHGRCRHVITDQRAYRSPNAATDNSSKTMLGATQLAWFFAELDALAAGQTEMLFWHSSSLYAIASSDPGEDTWGTYSYERGIIAAKIAALGIGNRIVLLGSDIHSFGFDDGTNNAWGGFPSFHCGSLNADVNLRGKWSHGSAPGAGRFGIVDVVDDGKGINVTVTGMIQRRKWRSLTIPIAGYQMPQSYEVLA